MIGVLWKLYLHSGNINYGGNTVYCPWKQDGPRCSACPSGLTCAPGDCICANNTVTAQTSAPVSSPTVAPQPQTTNAAGATQPGAGTTGAPAQVSTGGAAVTQAPQPTVTGNTPVTQAITTARAANPTTAAGANPITTASPAAGSCAARVTPTGSPPSCSTSSPPAIQYTYTAATPSSTEIGEILTAHNNYRRNISATDMRALTWNDCAASNAQYWANQCVFGHDQNSRVIPGMTFTDVAARPFSVNTDAEQHKQNIRITLDLPLPFHMVNNGENADTKEDTCEINCWSRSNSLSRPLFPAVSSRDACDFG